MKKLLSILMAAALLFSSIVFQAEAKTPEVMSALKSHIKTYGAIKVTSGTSGNKYTAKISYQKKKKNRQERFLYQCTYTNGRSTSKVKMYMPVSKKKAKYTVHFSQTIVGTSATAKLSGKATLKRKTYRETSTVLKFSRKNKNSVAKRITGSAYQNAANSLTRVAFSLWEQGIEKQAAMSLRNFGFNKIGVYDPNANTKEW